MPGEAAVMNVSAKGADGHERALGVDLGGVAVRDRAHRGRRRHEVDLAAQVAGHHEVQEVRVVEQVPHEGPLARAAESGHPVLDVGDEALARLLPVVADVDPRLDLRGHDARRWRRARPAPARPRRRLPRLRRPCSSARARGRGRLPAWVVRIRVSLRSMPLPVPAVGPCSPRAGDGGRGTSTSSMRTPSGSYSDAMVTAPVGAGCSIRRAGPKPSASSRPSTTSTST